MKKTSPDKNNPILLVGAGPMAIAYAKVLSNLKKNFLIVGRGESSAHLFTKATGKSVILGGLNRWLENNQVPLNSIVAVNVASLGSSARLLLRHNAKRLLLEKPGGISFSDIKKTAVTAKKNLADVFIGYNRRFLSSITHARKLVDDDGGLLSIFFDFTEQGLKIGASSHPLAVKNFWLLANSSHVIDLAFYLAGKPRLSHSLNQGRLSWHQPAAWSGSGLTKKNILYSYRADWRSPGRWRIELYTKNRRLVLEPLEELKEQLPGSFSLKPIFLKKSLDQKFKPGLYEQVKEFLNPTTHSLPSISQHLESFTFYRKLYRLP